MMICLLYLVRMIENDCGSSSICVSNNVKETQFSMEQDVDLSGASSIDASSSTTFCLMAKDSKVSSTLNPICLMTTVVMMIMMMNRM